MFQNCRIKKIERHWYCFNRVDFVYAIMSVSIEKHNEHSLKQECRFFLEEFLFPNPQL